VVNLLSIPANCKLTHKIFFNNPLKNRIFNLVKIVESTLSGIFILLIILGIFLFAYVQYGNKLSRNMRLDDGNPTPANTLTDKIDYVPARAPVLLGHHFASIAGAGPIVGPIIASLWLVTSRLMDCIRGRIDWRSA